LAERTSARRRSESSGSAQRQLGGGGNSSVGGFFGLDAQVGGQRASDSRTVQSDLLTGTITARVVEVDAAGNLVIEGERRLNVDGDVHMMTVSGMVRPADVEPSNTVLSYQIAGADVVYQQEPSGPKFLQGRFLTLVGTAVVLVGAVLLGSAAGGE
ncbi:flagellar basal body L-ring protein FlgH, partial [Rubrivirga sp.]|uniref:flagellar basal body L-ring protein FlgH n=1 Tax=Rubrivirga sp. TaxID=1885344 RepID=UPI003C7742BE